MLGWTALSRMMRTKSGQSLRVGAVRWVGAGGSGRVYWIQRVPGAIDQPDC